MRRSLPHARVLLSFSSLALLTGAVLSGVVGCDSAPRDEPDVAAAPGRVKAAETKVDDADDPSPDPASDPAAMPSGAETGEGGEGAASDDAANGDAVGATADGSSEAAETDTGAGTPAAEAAAPAAPSAPKSDDIRDASHVPTGTPGEHASAFRALPVAKGDGAPIGGIGPGGIHLDDLVVGTDWEDSRCQTPQASFSVATDERVSLCLRIVHQPRDEPLTISWEREGKSPKRANLNVKGIHAYRTRAWLPVKNYYKGNWKVRVLASDETVLGEGSFEITD